MLSHHIIFFLPIVEYISLTHLVFKNLLYAIVYLHFKDGPESRRKCTFILFFFFLNTGHPHILLIFLFKFCWKPLLHLSPSYPIISTKNLPRCLQYTKKSMKHIIITYLLINTYCIISITYPSSKYMSLCRYLE